MIRDMGMGRASLRIFALSILLFVGVLAGCSGPRTPLPATPPSATAPTTAPATPSSRSTTDATAPPRVDASGAALGSTISVSGASKPAIGKIARPTHAATVAAAKRVLAENEGATVTSMQVVAMTQDTKGTWWVLLTVNDAQLGKTKLVVWFDGTRWDEQVYATTISDTDLPSGVKF